MGAAVGRVAGVGWVLEGGGSWFVVSGFPPARELRVVATKHDSRWSVDKS